MIKQYERYITGECIGICVNNGKTAVFLYNTHAHIGNVSKAERLLCERREKLNVKPDNSYETMRNLLV